jgi:hypothetical protein
MLFCWAYLGRLPLRPKNELTIVRQLLVAMLQRQRVLRLFFPSSQHLLSRGLQRFVPRLPHFVFVSHKNCKNR